LDGERVWLLAFLRAAIAAYSPTQRLCYTAALLYRIALGIGLA
jgi:hypothetical protein